MTPHTSAEGENAASLRVNIQGRQEVCTAAHSAISSTGVHVTLKPCTAALLSDQAVDFD